MILTKEQIADRRNRLTAVNRTHACQCLVRMTIRTEGFWTFTTKCTEITYCDLHDPQDYLDTIEAAWQERDTSGSEGG